MTSVGIIDNGSDCLHELTHFFDQLEYNYDILPLEKASFRRASHHDIIVLTGGIWYNDAREQTSHYSDELSFIAQSGVPVIGICLGMQLIIAAFDGDISPLNHLVRGEKQIYLTDRGEAIIDLSRDFTVFENHTMGAKVAPNTFDVLARSSECIEIIRHKSLPIYGMQFHPELLKNQGSFRLWSSLVHDLHSRTTTATSKV